MARIPTGILMSNIKCQLKLSIIKPPIRGPNETEAAAAIAQKPSAMPLCFTGNSLVMMAIPSGWIVPAPSPWIILEVISMFSLTDIPQSNEPVVKSSNPRKYILL
jgi:hypothetical protein